MNAKEFYREFLLNTKEDTLLVDAANLGIKDTNIENKTYLEDAGTCAVPLVPWSVAGTYMAATLGVPTLSYLPWTILCYSSFIFAIIFAYTGFGIAKIKK